MNAFLLLLVSMIVIAGNNQQKGKYISILNTKIYYEEHGKGVPLIILSGGGLDRSVRDFDKIIPLLKTKYRLILPDSPGQGKSEQPDTLTYELLTDYFSRFIDALHLDSCYVMGWSDGGIASLMLAGRKTKKVRKVIAVGANNGLKDALPPEYDINEVKPQELSAWGANNKFAVASYSKEMKRDWKRMMNSLNAMWYQHKYFSDDLLTAIEVPVMITQGDRDEMIVEHAVSLHRKIRNSQLCILPATTHDVFRERPELISRIAIDLFR